MATAVFLLLQGTFSGDGALCGVCSSDLSVKLVYLSLGLVFGLEISVPSFGFCRFRVASFVGGAGFSSGPPLLGGVAFVADGLVFVPSFDFVRLKGGRRIRCGLWLASSLRRGGSFQSSPSVGLGFRLSVSPAVAEFLPVFTCCGDG